MTAPEEEPPRTVPRRVYVDMVGDLFHPGHVEVLRRARELGDEVVVGVLSDRAATAYKRRPVMSLDERVAVVASCRYVDEVLADAPLRLTHAFLDRHRLALVVHGDDLSDAAAAEVYAPAVERGVLRVVPRTTGVSTTELIARVHERGPGGSRPRAGDGP